MAREIPAFAIDRIWARAYSCGSSSGGRLVGRGRAAKMQTGHSIHGLGSLLEEPVLPHRDEFKAALLAEGVDLALIEAAAGLPPLKISTPEEIAARRAERRERIAREKADGTRNADGSRDDPSSVAKSSKGAKTD
ncbi:MAG: hypothetical protein P0Y66_14615 [Candidatus Kaistia colombiensis]|nr:MAG: hypothetical protein P0Y66_14615 [Kaistia sp.]